MEMDQSVLSRFPNPPVQGGLALRDYFAAQALGSLVQLYAKDRAVSWMMVADMAYTVADKMLEERMVHGEEQ
jgi:hypothetical protein